jgi:hypothetical protein
VCSLKDPSMPPSPRAHSGLQKQVLALFRSVLREARRKDLPTGINATVSGSGSIGERASVSSAASNGSASFPLLLSDRSTTTSYASREFRKQASAVRRSDFKKIEYMIRKGEKQLKVLRMPGVLKVEGTS